MAARLAVLGSLVLVSACAGGFTPFTPSPDDPVTAARIAAAEAGPVPALGDLPQRPNDVRTGSQFVAAAVELSAAGEAAVSDPEIRAPEPRSSAEAFIEDGRRTLSEVVREAEARRPGEPVLAPAIPPAS